MSKLTDYWPSWGSSGSQWSAGGDWAANDQVSELTMDYLFDSLNKFQNSVYDYLETDGVTPSASGTVTDGDAKLLHATELADDEEIRLTQATLIASDGDAIPSGVDLVIATLDSTDGDGGTVQATAISGDGTTVHDDETGTPVANYTNTSGSAQTVALVVDNGNFTGASGGAGTSVDHQVSVIGRTQ